MLEEQNRFITDASHELRTPLTSLRSEIEVGLRNKALSLNDTKKLLVSNLEEVISLQTLSDNLLELAQNGRFIDPNNFEQVSITEIVNNAIKKVHPLAVKKEIKLKIKLEEVKIYGVADRLVEVFVILLDNAIKFSLSKNEVEIYAKKAVNYVEVDIINYGIGIADKDLPKIFDRFYRVDKSRSKTSGYGLGLSIAKQIIETHEGSIAAISQENEKTTFKVKFEI